MWQESVHPSAGSWQGFSTSHRSKPNVTSVVACSWVYFQERNQPPVLPHGQIPAPSSVVALGVCRELLKAPVLPALHLCQDHCLAFPRSNLSSPRPSLGRVQLFPRRPGLPIWSQDSVCHPAVPAEPCSFPQALLRLSPMGLGWSSQHMGRCCAWLMFLHFSLGGPSCFGGHLMDFPKDGLMSGGFPSASIPAVHPLFPKADPRESPGSPAVAWNCFLQDGGGTGPAAVVLVFGQLQAVPIPVPQPGCPGFCHLGMMPRMGIPFPSQPPLKAPGLSPADFPIPPCPSTVCRPCHRAG